MRKHEGPKLGGGWILIAVVLLGICMSGAGWILEVHAANPVELPVGAVPMGTVNAEMGEQGRLVQEQEAALLNRQRLKDFRNFIAIWLVLLLVGYLIWRFRPRKPWIASAPAAKPEVEVEIEEDAEAAVIKPVLSDGHLRRSRDALITIALGWEERYGLSPLDLPVIAARDAALLVGMSDERYSLHMQDRVFPAPNDVNFIYNKNRYIVRCVRYSPTTDSAHVPRIQSGGWDYLVFVAYDVKYVIMGAWQMSHDAFQRQCGHKEQVTPADLQYGKNMLGGPERVLGSSG
ncbi:MAG: hypothetical protein G8237_11125 [Magnetococcales bacterium]|nr:hypothetical protein [Magnetococcales bacterium]NGZ06895.1 hypothetical protein [Magnetococcales bacterium]